MPPASDWKCCHCNNIWSYILYVVCVNCEHHKCSYCTPLLNNSRPKPKPRHPQRAIATASQPNLSQRAPTMNTQTNIYASVMAAQNFGKINGDARILTI